MELPRRFTLAKAKQIKEFVSHFFFFLEEWVHIASSGTYHPGYKIKI